jgi:hypothetical protein
MADNRLKLEKLLSILKAKLLESHKAPWGKYVFENFTIPADRLTEYYFEDFNFIYDELKEFLQKWYIETYIKDEKTIVDEFHKDFYQEYWSRIFEQQSQEFCYGREKELSELFLELVDLCDEAIRLYRQIIQENTTI